MYHLYMLPRNSPPPTSPNDEVACLLTAAYLATQNTKHNSHLWFHQLLLRSAYDFQNDFLYSHDQCVRFTKDNIKTDWCH